MSDHTPGPWTARRNVRRIWEGGAESEHPHWLVDPVANWWAPLGEPRGMSEADARLIAAAPEMAELLERIADQQAGVSPNDEPLSGEAYALLARISSPDPASLPLAEKG